MERVWQGNRGDLPPHQARFRRVGAIVGVLLTLGHPAPASARAPVIPDERSALIAFKALGYEESTRASTDERGIVVLHFSRATRERAAQVQATLAEARRRSHGSGVVLGGGESIVIYDGPLLSAQLTERKARLLYLVTEGDISETAVSQIRSDADQADVIVFADSATYLGRCAALSVELVESAGSSRVQICADLNTASEQGGQFAAEFLRLCRVVKK